MIIPSGRTGKYTIWRACERFGVLPPGVRPTWDKCNVEAKADLLGYEHIRGHDENERDAALSAARMI
jgi:hypothetical protein